MIILEATARSPQVQLAGKIQSCEGLRMSAKLAHNPKGCAGASKFELRLKLIMDQAPFDKRDAGRGSGNRLEMDWTWDCSPPFSLILEG